jgi:hypothetical protein
MNIKDIENIKTKDEARDFAIEWQNYASEKSMFLSEVLDWSIAFEDLAKKFDLVDEFRENGIV